ncbi:MULTISPECIES: alpha/beta-hydrolase family protein [unclassified Rhodococcus (in: high G+C Gram-positive bacteria)]|uniref:alpha/beta hydrolase n=1 Tax=unclassified Rhodococcus (in: high G+C Gram-positive bacteria) TaxID=192944 RepID=UPI00163B11F3|nr:MULTISPECIES: alpha/beta-hydrolase family protein [unclassified Rhodococcus (in: high G+C Gram-positive bacteria)]MBC2638234.1 alpha/beta-hydrolase family protein [Rhodococcus sp. 3A]MBC2897023.1 alpha/beta-hydrolase family protein [Rhodococcus sp. 4CII]
MSESDTTQESAPEPHTAEAAKPAAERDWWKRHYTFTGTAVGLVFLWLSMTPSLLPRGPLFQGLVSGAAGAIGYAIGVFAVWLVRYMASKNASPPARRVAWIVLIVVGAVGTIAMIVWFHVWQDHVRDLMGVPRLSRYDYLLTPVLALVVLFVLVEIGQLIGKLIRFLVRQLNRVAPPRVSAVIAVLLVAGLGIALLNGVVVRFAMHTLNATFEAVNNEQSPDTPPPASPQRSGGPDSLVSWDSLGHQGRIFVDGGPTTAQLTEFNGAPAVEPIRAYAGLNSADGIQATAELAARELERTGGLQRKVVAVATTTGTGWINEAEADAVEYMFNGETAIVSMQYSFLPSWLSFLVDKQNARQAGQALFEAVDRRVQALPEGQRPKLVVFGESLGSFGGEAPFLSPNNIEARTDGALFSGPTFNNTMWEDVTTHRDDGSPQWLPIYQQGDNLRFVARPDDLGRPGDLWATPRVVYLQHASDPIAWWNPALLFTKPDWLREPRGYDVPDDMQWIPVVTFLQVSADMAVAIDVPDGHGHRYVDDVANGWAAVLQPPGWTPEKTERLRPIMRADE